MRIIMIHNKYQYQGGEDTVFQAESDLLLQQGHSVEQLVFDNKLIQSAIDKFILAIKGIYNSKSARELEKLIVRFGPDIIHTHNFFPLASPSVFFIAKKYNIPTVVTLHNFRLVCPSATLYYDGKIYEENIHKLLPWHAIVKGVYRDSKLQTAGLALITSFHNVFGTWRSKVDKFIVLTEFAKRKFKDSVLRVNENQFEVKSNFVEDYGYGDRMREDFFIVGRLSEEKGIDVALMALSYVNFRLVIIGDGPLKADIVSAAKLNPNIEYLGFQKKATIIEYLKRCKALLFPSVCYEGFSMAILEAFSTGTPVIASNLGSMAEIVQDGDNGLHFNPGNAQDLGAKIALLQGDLDLAKRLSMNARKTYLRNYTPGINYQKLINIYSQLLHAKHVSVQGKD